MRSHSLLIKTLRQDPLVFWDCLCIADHATLCYCKWVSSRFGNYRTARKWWSPSWSSSKDIQLTPTLKEHCLCIQKSCRPSDFNQQRLKCSTNAAQKEDLRFQDCWCRPHHELVRVCGRNSLTWFRPLCCWKRPLWRQQALLVGRSEGYKTACKFWRFGGTWARTWMACSDFFLSKLRLSMLSDLLPYLNIAYK